VGQTAADAAVRHPNSKRIYTWGSVLDFAVYYEFTLGVVYWILQGIVSELLHYYWVSVSTNTPVTGASFEKEAAQIGLVCKINLIYCRSDDFLRGSICMFAYRNMCVHLDALCIFRAVCLNIYPCTYSYAYSYICVHA